MTSTKDGEAAERAVEVSDDAASAAMSAAEAAELDELAETLGVAAEFVPGARLFLHAVGGHRRRRARRNASAYLLWIAEQLGRKDTQALAAELASDPGSDAWDLIEVGFQQMMSAIHEDAKKCIAAVFADYRVNKKQPDREYQLAGGLLAQCDRPMLDGLVALTRGFTAVANVVHEGAKLGVHDDRVWWTSFNDRSASESSRRPEGFESIVRSLVRFEYGDDPPPVNVGRANMSPAADKPGGEQGEAKMFVRPLHVERWRRLTLYLAPLGTG